MTVTYSPSPPSASLLRPSCEAGCVLWCVYTLVTSKSLKPAAARPPTPAPSRTTRPCTDHATRTRPDHHARNQPRQLPHAPVHALQRVVCTATDATHDRGHRSDHSLCTTTHEPPTETVSDHVIMCISKISETADASWGGSTMHLAPCTKLVSSSTHIERTRIWTSMNKA